MPSAVTTHPVPAKVRRPRAADFSYLVGLLAGQVILSLAMAVTPHFATAHALVTGAVAVLAVLSRRPESMVLAAAYVAGSENLWRVTGAVMPYSYPNYVLLLLVIGLMGRNGSLRTSVLPLVFLAALVPATVQTLYESGFSEGRERIVFTVLPLVVLALGVISMRRYSVTDAFRRQIVAAIVVPTVGLAAVVLFRILDASQITFAATGSNFETSAGFGPNRIAASLGFAALLCLLEAQREHRSSLMAVEIGLGVWLGCQSALTFSRGGILSVLAGLSVAVVYRAVRRRQLVRSLAVVGAVAAIVIYVVVPRLESFTAGTLNARFSQLHTERTDLAGEDLRLFRDHPLIGVGAGRAAYMRSSGVLTPSHTEYTRLLAEHGSLGILAILLLLAMAARALLRAPRSYRPYCLAVLLWVFSQMAYANLRISAVAFAFAFAFLRPVAAVNDSKPVPVPGFAGSNGG